MKTLPSLLKTILVTLLGLCITGCQDSATTWSAEAKSPDGQWIATARSQQWGGPGTAYDATTVYLQRIERSQHPTEVLLFSHQFPTINLKMEWVTPTHLEVAYGPRAAGSNDHVSLDFQIARMNGIDISVRELPAAVTNTSR